MNQGRHSKRDRRLAFGVAAAVIGAIVLVVGSLAVADIINGTSGGGLINGTDGRDLITGGSGDELIYGRGGDDVINAGAGNDEVFGGDGNDEVFGGPGSDMVVGGPGNNELGGGPGRNYYGADYDGQPLDEGASGNDTIYARNGTPDVINCGGGYDIAYVDRVEDGIYDCEVVIRP